MASSLGELGGQLVGMAGKLLSLLACEYSATNKAKAKGFELVASIYLLAFSIVGCRV